MSGIFRQAFRLPRPVQLSLGALTRAPAGGGTIQPGHLPSSASTPAPALRFALAAAHTLGGSAYGAPTLRLTLKPVAPGTGNAFYTTTVSTGVTILPGLFANGSNFHGARIIGTLKPAAHSNGQSFFSPRVNRRVAAPPLASGSSYHAPRLTLRPLATVHANANTFHAPTRFQPGMKSAPFLAGSGAIFAPSVTTPFVSHVVGTLNVAGWTPRAPAPRRAAVTWPNLPKVEAPPWRLMVVTPEVARERARTELARRKRARDRKRERDIDREVETIFNRIVDDEVVRTVARLVTEDA